MVLGIYGASGLGRELLELANLINCNKSRWQSIVFIDDGDVPSEISHVPVFKYEAAKGSFGNELEIVIAVGEPSIRKALFAKVKRDKIHVPTLIHPDVYIPKSTTIGDGVTIQYGCFISCNVRIGNYVFIQPQCNIGHDCVLDEGCIIAGFGNIGGIVHIGQWSYLGLSVAVMQQIQIGNNSVVGMGSVVVRDVQDNVIAMGNPARAMKINEGRVFNH